VVLLDLGVWISPGSKLSDAFGHFVGGCGSLDWKEELVGSKVFYIDSGSFVCC